MTGIIVNKKDGLIRAALGCSVLLLGTAEYICNRPPESSHLGVIIKSISGNIPLKIDVFGIFSGVLPDFAHAFSFSLFTLLLFPNAVRKMRIAICLFWLVIDVFFEIGQFFGQQISGIINIILPPNPAASFLKAYFVNGTYDPMDILAIGLGAGTAFLIGESTTKGDLKNGIDDKNKNQFTLASQSPCV
jgi:hypothetical protein